MRYIIDFCILAIVYMVLYRKKLVKKKENLIVNTVMFVYICGVLYFTLMPIGANLLNTINNLFNNPYNATTVNLMPFDDYMNGRGDVLRQIVLNILLFMPFGFILPIVTKTKLVKVSVATFLLSLGIEVLQPLFWRSFDVTDLITNTIGGTLGYIVYLILKPFTVKAIAALNKKFCLTN